MGILAHHRDTNCSGPVEVQMSQFVGQDLDLSWFESGGIFDHVVGRRVD